MKKLALIATTCLAGLTLAACGNQHHSSKGADSSSATSKTARSSSQKSGSSSVSQSSSSAAASSSSAAVQLTGGQSSVDYITQKMGDQGWTIDGGTYGGAHGAPTDGSYVPYNSVRNDNGDVYYVYQDGRIEKQAE